MTTDIDALSTFLQTGLPSAVVAVLTLGGVGAALVFTDPTLGAAMLPLFPLLIVATVVFRKISACLRGPGTGERRQRRLSGERRRHQDHSDLPRNPRRPGPVYRPHPRLGRCPDDLAAGHLGVLPVHHVHRRCRSGCRGGPGRPPDRRGRPLARPLVAFILYLTMLFGPVQQLSQVFDGYQQAAVGLLRISDLLSTPSSLMPVPGARTPRHLDGDVRLDGVGFRYPRATADALTDMTLTIPAGTSSPSSALPAPASRRSSNCSPVSTTSPPVPSASAAPISA